MATIFKTPTDRAFNHYPFLWNKTSFDAYVISFKGMTFYTAYLGNAIFVSVISYNLNIKLYIYKFI